MSKEGRKGRRNVGRKELSEEKMEAKGKSNEAKERTEDEERRKNRRKEEKMQGMEYGKTKGRKQRR